MPKAAVSGAISITMDTSILLFPIMGSANRVVIEIMVTRTFTDVGGELGCPVASERFLRLVVFDVVFGTSTTDGILGACFCSELTTCRFERFWVHGPFSIYRSKGELACFIISGGGRSRMLLPRIELTAARSYPSGGKLWRLEITMVYLDFYSSRDTGYPGHLSNH